MHRLDFERPRPISLRKIHISAESAADMRWGAPAAGWTRGHCRTRRRRDAAASQPPHHLECVSSKSTSIDEQLFPSYEVVRPRA